MLTSVHAHIIFMLTSNQAIERATSGHACSCRSGPQQLWPPNQQHHGQLICQRTETSRGESLQAFPSCLPTKLSSLADAQHVWLQVLSRMLRQAFRGTSTGSLLVWSCVAIAFCL